MTWYEELKTVVEGGGRGADADGELDRGLGVATVRAGAAFVGFILF